MNEGNENTTSRHKQWRRLAKKERRRRIRQKAAQERDADEEHLRAALETSAEYLNWLEQQEKEEKEREAREQEEHAERERLWLEEEARAQKEWQALQERKAKARQDQLIQEEIIRKEFEEKQEAMRKKKEEAKRLQEEEIKKHEDLQKQIDDYIDNGAETPKHLRNVSESQSGKELCPFFTKTGACRYGDICSRNHRRVFLSKVILVPGFYSHFSMEKNSAEYDTDISLEFESSETRQHFREFYKDVVPELESFGRIKTLKYCCNTEIHLRGNLYVEYYSEREAAKAWRRLKGRYYAGRQLNCEFVNLKSWRNAVCGMNKCPKGRACNFLHTFRNPHDEYDIKSPPRWSKKNESSEGTSSRRSEQRTKSKWEEMDHCSTEDNRNWRWSESPEPEMEHRSKSERTKRHTEERSERRTADEKRKAEERIESRHTTRSERRRGESERSSSRSSKIDSDLQKLKLSSRKSRRSESKHKDEENVDCREEYSSRHREKKPKKRKKNNETDDEKRDSRRNSEDRKTKSSRNIERTESLHRHEKMKEEKKKRKAKIEIPEPDENINTNSNDSCAKVIENIESLQSEKKSPEKTVEVPKSKWDTAESYSSTPKKDSKSDLVSPIIIREKEDTASPPRNKRFHSASDNEWDTTDSENE